MSVHIQMAPTVYRPLTLFLCAAVACINKDGTLKDQDRLHRFLLSYTQWLSPDQMFSLLLGTVQLEWITMKKVAHLSFFLSCRALWLL